MQCKIQCETKHAYLFQFPAKHIRQRQTLDMRAAEQDRARTIEVRRDAILKHIIIILWSEHVFVSLVEMELLWTNAWNNRIKSCCISCVWVDLNLIYSKQHWWTNGPLYAPISFYFSSSIDALLEYSNHSMQSNWCDARHAPCIVLVCESRRHAVQRHAGDQSIKWMWDVSLTTHASQLLEHDIFDMSAPVRHCTIASD